MVKWNIAMDNTLEKGRIKVEKIEGENCELFM